MIAFFTPFGKSLSSITAAHKRARGRKIRLEQRRSTGRSIFVYLLTRIAQRLERRAFRQLASVRMTDPEDARQKLVYLMAVMMADRASPSETQLSNAIETLRPYKASLAEHLQRRTINGTIVDPSTGAYSCTGATRSS
jgi:hypothetical protein